MFGHRSHVTTFITIRVAVIVVNVVGYRSNVTAYVTLRIAFVVVGVSNGSHVTTYVTLCIAGVVVGVVITEIDICAAPQNNGFTPKNGITVCTDILSPDSIGLTALEEIRHLTA